MTNLSGATTAVFIISLSSALEVPVNVAWETKDGTAKAGTHYEAASGSVTFDAGETQKQIQVTVYGREDGDTASRKFSILLYPPENAILDQTLTEVEIQVTDSDGIAVTSLVVPTGPRGLKGDPGLSAYELAKIQGFEGTLQEWLEIQNPSAEMLQKAEEAASSAAEAKAYRDQTQQIINDAGEQSTLVVLAQEDGAKKIGYKNPRFDGVYPSSLLDIAYNKISLLEFIPPSLHDGIRNYTYTGDLSVYVQKAIDTANAMGGATIMCPAGQYYMNVQTKPNVILIGARANTVRRAMPWAFTVAASPGSTRFRNYSGSDWIIKSATSNLGDVTSRSFGVIGIDFDAKDATNSTGGVRLRGPEFCVKSCSFYGFQDQGLEASGNIGLVEDVIANNCLLNRVRNGYVGTVEISGASDCQIHRVEGNAQVVGLGNITNAEPYICGIKIAGNNHYVSGLMGEISETGIYLSASSIHHKVSDCRADNNTGPGYLLDGVMLVNSHSYNNSRAGSGLYSAFAALPSSSRLMLSNCLAWTDSAPVDGTGQQRMHKHGYDVAAADYLSLRLKPWINQCFSYGHSDSWINTPPTYGMQYTPYVGLLSVTSNATTTPNVDGVSVVSINTTSLSEITGLSGGTVGQTVDIYLNATATVTLRNSASFLVNNFAANNDKVMVRGRVYKFIKTASNIWREVGDAPRTYSGTTAERPSAAAVPGMHYFDTTLNKPIWRNAANTGWVDATGTAV